MWFGPFRNFLGLFCSKLVFCRQKMLLKMICFAGIIVENFTIKRWGTFWAFFHSKMFYVYRTKKVPKMGSNQYDWKSSITNILREQWFLLHNGVKSKICIFRKIFYSTFEFWTYISLSIFKKWTKMFFIIYCCVCFLNGSIKVFVVIKHREPGVNMC